MFGAPHIRLWPALCAALALLACGAASASPGGVASARGPGGKILFVAACGSCHRLAAAGTSGRAGPDLDDEAPSYGDLVEQIRQGGEGMPAFGRTLPALEIRRIAAFVSAATAGSRDGGDD